MNPQLKLTFCLLILFHIKHYIADFPLQREYMLRKSLPGWGFIVPLSLHVGIHAFLTLMICLYFAPQLWWLAAVDFVVHFIVDRLKSGPRFLGRYNDLSKASYWNILGLDQMAHHLTHLAFVFLIVRELAP